jgi:ATP-dependent DNA ligase
MVFSHDGEVEVYSRNGKPMPGGEDIAKPLSRYFAGYVLDGELAASDRFKSISKARSKSGNRDGLNYYAFDIMPITCWQQSDPTSLISRRKTLVERFMDVPEEHRHSLMLLPVNRLIDPTTEQIHQEMKTYRDHGFEGAVLKNVQSPYKFDRSGDWLKCKPVDTGDFRLVDIERGHGRLQGTCGNLVVDVDGVRVRVGTGLNDQMRNYFWFNRNELLEQNLVIEVGYEQRTPDGSLNFPRFIKIRKDKINE